MIALLTIAIAAPALAAAPTALRCEYQTNPIGIDVAAPRLSWQLNDADRGAAQTAYQVIVADSADDARRNRGTVWDTGKVESDQSIHVVYDGPPVQSRAAYYWRVRTWDVAGVVSAWSRPASFEMGLLDESEWEADWITMSTGEATTPVGQWIWAPDRSENQTIALTKTFEVDGPVDAAEVRFTADNYAKVSINGAAVGEHDDWRAMLSADVTAALRSGENTISVEATNEDGPAAFVAGLRATLVDGSEVVVTSDDTWAAGDTRAVVIAPYGGGPWGRHDDGGRRSIRVRREADLEPGFSRARAYVTGLGLYEMFINGERVGEDVFTPGWTHYGKRVQYQTYDVTDLLEPGSNAIGAQLGSGWFSGRINKHLIPEGGTNAPRFLLKLVVDYPDRTETIHTDSTWKATPSPIVADDFYDGETYDARMEQDGWAQPGFDDSVWNAARVLDEPIGELVAQAGPTMRVTAELPAEEITEPTEGVYVVDFGQNASGRTRLIVKGGEAGQEIRIRHAEVLNDDGTIYTDNYRSAKVTDTYICRGDAVETWESSFTYRGFRYAEVTGYPGELPGNALVSLPLNSAPDWAGEFACSNDLINRVNENIRWGQIGNMHSVPTDCPQRDERLGWTGDALIIAPTTCWNMDMARFFTKWSRDLTDSQGPNGEMSDIAPIEHPHGPASPGWGDVIATVPWNVYQFYGDTRIIEETYDGLKAWVEFMRSQAPDLLYEREGYGDWVAVVGSPKKPIGAAYYHYSAQLLARMAEAIGRDDDAREYGALADAIAAAFSGAYLDTEASTYLGGTQTANILPLAFGITPTDRREAIAESIADDIIARDNHLSTGFLGTSYLMPTLSANGYHELAYTLADQRTYPSWGYMVEKGATSIWELWNSDTQGPGMNSRNHYAFGSVGQWYYEHLAGIQPLEPGFKRTLIAPMPAGDLTWVTASYPSMYGDIESRWRIKADRLTLDVTVPPNTTAEIRVPVTGDAPTITESGVTIVESGARANRADGLRFRGVADGAAILDAEAGRYHFVGL